MNPGEALCPASEKEQLEREEESWARPGVGFSLQPHYWDLTPEEAGEGQLSPTQRLKDTEAVKLTLLMLVPPPTLAHCKQGQHKERGKSGSTSFQGEQ